MYQVDIPSLEDKRALKSSRHMLDYSCEDDSLEEQHVNTRQALDVPTQVHLHLACTTLSFAWSRWCLRALQDKAMVCQERQADTPEPSSRSTIMCSVSQLKPL